MTAIDPATDLLVLPGNWNFDYRYFAGATASRFFAELRDHQRIMGRRCPGCRRLVVPARSYCDDCFEPMGEWEQVGTEGTIDAFTIIATAFPGLPEPPLLIAFVTLEGADSAILNFVEGLDLADYDAVSSYLFTHDRVRVVFKDSRAGRITDFHFECLEQ